MSYMTYDDLTREQKNQIAGNYLCRLADEGVFAEVMGVDYDEPSWHDMIFAVDIVPDDVMRREYDGVYFTEGDFS